jgi:hypothetical protein
MNLKTNNQFAGIEYSGTAGDSLDCQEAIFRLIQYNYPIKTVQILTYENNHALLLKSVFDDYIGIKSGFSSGYGGTGPHAFSYVLQLLKAHGAEIDEHIVEEAIIERLDNSSLFLEDITNLENTRPIRPRRWFDYIFESDINAKNNGTLWREFDPVIPYAIIDSRITDLAINFWENPDNNILTAYRRLEDVIRKRTLIDDYGAKLFSKAFLGDPPQLTWQDINNGEATGRAQLFTGTYMAYRNPRAHKEQENLKNGQLEEFLNINNLYLLERSAIINPQNNS